MIERTVHANGALEANYDYGSLRKVYVFIQSWKEYDKCREE